MNKPLADEAIRAVTAPDYTKKRQQCKIWVRQVVWKVYGDDRFREVLGAGYTPDAASSGRALVRAGLTAPTKPLQLGDLLVWYAGEYGHIAIYVGDGRIAENYTPHAAHNGGDARGFRRVAGLSPWNVTARLPLPDAPAPAKLYTLRLHTVPIAQMPVIDGRALAPVRAWARALGLEVVWDGGTKRVWLGGHEYAAEPDIIDGASHFPVRDLARWSGLELRVDDAARTVEVVRP